MKKTAFTFLAALATVFGLTQCNQNKSMHTVHFYTSIPASKQPLTLFIDGAAAGTLPYSPTDITCSNISPEQAVIIRELEAGKYDLEARDSQGNVNSGATLKVSETILGGSGGKYDGGMAVNGSGVDNRCVIVNLF